MVRMASAAALYDEACSDPAAQEREFAFGDADFRMLAKFAHEKAGIALSEAKRNLVYGRLSRRLRALRLPTFAAYREYLLSDRAEAQRFINAISTNLTKFFRESHHFKHLHATLAAPFAERAKREPSARLRIWSAGCSTGEEPYSIAAIIGQALPGAGADARILATDIDTDVVASAARAEYPPESIEDVPPAFRGLFCQKQNSAEGKLVVEERLRDLVRFRRLNLIDDWPFKGKFDAIFCRNVMIYFDVPTKARLLQRLAEQLAPQGWLYIGHSESLTRAHPLLELEGRTIYRRRA